MLARFWAELLDRSSVGDGHGVLLPGNDTQVGLRFVRSDAERREPAYLHLHLTSSSAANQSDTVAAALRLGARHLDVGQRAEEEHIVLADPEGNAFCVIEPGNAYLTGTGFLGEVACDGSRKVGLFWRDALGWPLVWDQDEETAIQDPRGGTKMAWGGESPDTRAGATGSSSTSGWPMESSSARSSGWSLWAPTGSGWSRTRVWSWPTPTATRSPCSRTDETSQDSDPLSAQPPPKGWLPTNRREAHIRPGDRSATVHFAAVRSWIHSGHHAAVGRAQ